MVDRPPVIAAWGPGVDSTAMIVELAERSEAKDMVLFADPGAEKSATWGRYIERTQIYAKVSPGLLRRGSGGAA
jgi:hypothetical protein